MKKLLIRIFSICFSGDFRRESKLSHGAVGVGGREEDEEEDGRSSTTSVGQNEILGAIEEAYPNSLTIDDMAR